MSDDKPEVAPSNAELLREVRLRFDRWQKLFHTSSDPELADDALGETWWLAEQVGVLARRLEEADEQVIQTKIQLAAADEGLLKCSDPSKSWQGMTAECSGWQKRALAAEAALAAFKEREKLLRDRIERILPIAQRMDGREPRAGLKVIIEEFRAALRGEGFSCRRRGERDAMSETPEQAALRTNFEETAKKWEDKANAVLTTHHDLVRKPGYDAASVAKLLAVEQAGRLRAALAELRRLRRDYHHMSEIGL